MIPRWDEFQHRDMARSTIPPWIKNLTRLLNDDDYLNLTQSQRGVLHGLWLLYASHRRVLSEAQARHKLVTSAAEARRWRDNMAALNHAGFVELSASRPARHLASDLASLEVEVEDLTKDESSARANGSPDSRRIEKMLRNGVLTDEVDIEAELAASSLDEAQRAYLRSLIGTGGVAS